VQKLKSPSLVALILFIVVMVLGTYLFNQHLQRKANLELAQLAVEQTKAQKTQTADIAQSASEPTDQDLTEDATTQTPHVAVSADEIAGALAVVEEARASQNSATEHLTMQIDSEYHEGKTLSSNASKYGLKPIKTAPADLKATISSIDQMLASHLIDVWGRSSPDQVAKRVEGWSQQGNSITYRVAWDSDRFQCTWYVVRWNQSNNQVLSEGYKPCF
jgi:hypothetical protein